MDADTATWIREHALPDLYRTGPPAYQKNLCACQVGICGACEHGRHDLCLTLQHRKSGRSNVVDEGTITDRRGFVMSGRWPLWRAHGAPCRYICPCPADHLALLDETRDESPRRSPANTPAAALDQLDLLSPSPDPEEDQRPRRANQKPSYLGGLGGCDRPRLGPRSKEPIVSTALADAPTRLEYAPVAAVLVPSAATDRLLCPSCAPTPGGDLLLHDELEACSGATCDQCGTPIAAASTQPTTSSR